MLPLLALALFQSPDAVRPVDDKGRVLNLGFETGTLADWTAEGDAFKGQPIRGDTVKPRRGDMASGHAGEFWIGGYEKFGDKPTGTLTSVAFPVTHPYGSFLVAGGPTKQTRVELLVDGKVIHTATGVESETLLREVVDLRAYQGKKLQVRLVDAATGHWGHLNFDDFLFHANEPAKAPGRVAQVTPPDDYPFAGQPPQEAAKNMTVPKDFKVQLFAGEPDVHQPIAFCFDDRGRVWVLEAFCYPKRKPFPGPLLPDAEKKNGDKILIFEDTDGDGTFDKKTVFLEGLNLASGIEIGFGGVWVGAAPYLMFIPDADRDDMPDGPPQILLDGWGMQDTHETLNSFIWGPDGWLYGCHGVFTHSRVGKPGTPDADRIPINAGVWRYHPTRHVFEVYAHGISNPWGLDYNAVGDFFVEACVIPHLWHVVQGGRYARQAGQHFNPHTYADIPTIAKHRHYVGATPHGGNGRSDSAGGGHAHSGLICYQGGLWPKEYEGKLFMGNLHGHRINVDVITPKGSTYEGDRNPDFLLSRDRTCVIVAIHAGPDGNVFFCDWSDKQVCHRNEVEIWDRTNGRLFKIVHKDTKPLPAFDLQKCTDAELVAYQKSDNDWFARKARRILQERAAEIARDPRRISAVESAIAAVLTGAKTDTRTRLRTAWTAHAVGVVTYERLQSWILAERTPAGRGALFALWGEHLLRNGPQVNPKDVNLLDIAVKTAALESGGTSPQVVRAVAGIALRLPLETRTTLLRTLANPQGNADNDAFGKDPILPLLAWYAMEPGVEGNPAAALTMAEKSVYAELTPLAARRVGAIGTPAAFAVLAEFAGKATDSRDQLAYLRGLADGLRGRKSEMPKAWPDVAAKLAKSGNAEVRGVALAVGVAFGDESAIQQMFDVAADSKADTVTRQAALAAVLDASHNRTGGLLKQLLNDPAMRSAAIRGMARWQDDGIPAAILGVYPSLSAAEKRDAVATLTSRAKYAFALLDAVAAKQLPATDIPAEAVRQLRNLGDAALDAKVGAVWGTVRATPADRKRLIASWAAKLNAARPADVAHGRAIYHKVCAQCHTLYGTGGKVGPEITGANRGDLGYLLENILDPSAVIPKEYAATKLNLADGRVVTGIVKESTAATLTVATATETLTIPVADVEKRTPSDLSMMPDDLTKSLSEADFRDLIAYLRTPAQTPMLATAETAKEFFNGKDLTGWAGDPQIFSVENGEIVGRTKTGLKRNAFLVSQLDARDFKLTLEVKLTPDAANSGIQFRSVPLADGEMRGPQADAGAGWWGKFYEESGRGLLWKESGEKHVKPGEWNTYVIDAAGPKVRTWINGQLCVDLDDAKLSKSGQIGLQVHSGGPTEVRFRNLKLEVK